MSKKSVFSIATSRTQAEEIVENLRGAGFSNDDISALFSDQATTRDFALTKNTKAPEGIATGAGTGGVVGGALGWLASVGTLPIPCIGPLLIAGPAIAALSVAAVGATVGGIAGGMIGLGIPELEAKRYEGKLQQGNILLSVHTEDSAEARAAEAIFRDAGADDICATHESAPSRRERKRRQPVEV